MDQETNLLEPYVGPRPFEREEGEFFFGRRLEVNDLISLITAYPVVLLYAQSGAGKTSLLKASLLPGLEDENFAVLEPARVRMQGVLEVDPASIRNIFLFNALSSWKGKNLSQADLAQMSLKDFLKHRQATTNEEQPKPLVIVFDQFEELFTHHLDRWEDREEFFQQVSEALEANSDLRVYFVMREDYIAELDPYAQILPGKLRTRFRMERLRRENALDAIRGPLDAPSVKETGRRFAEGVAEALVDDLLKVRVQSGTGEKEVPGQFVEPVQLQVVCQALWHELTPEDKVITFDHLKAFGNVNEALTRFFNNTIKKAAVASGISEGALRRWFDRVLITPDGNRGTVLFGKDKTAGLPNAAIEVFERERLLRSEPRDGRLWYELSQDRLIKPIQNSYKQWLDDQPGEEQTRLRLEDQAVAWARRREKSLLLDQAQLLVAKRWFEEEADNYSEALYALVQASEAEFERTERERERKLTEEQRLRAEAETARAVALEVIAREQGLRAEAETERAAALETTAREQQLRADEKLQAYRRLKYLAAGLAAVLLLSIASTTYAFYQRGNAQRSATEAHLQAERAIKSENEAKLQAERAGRSERDAIAARDEAKREATLARAAERAADAAKERAEVARKKESQARLEAVAAKQKAEKATEAEKALTAQAETARVKAEQETKRADELKNISKSRELAAEALLQLNSDPELGLLLAIKAAEETKNPPKEARDALLEALSESHLRSVIRRSDNGEMLSAMFPDTKGVSKVLTVAENGEVQRWNAPEERKPTSAISVVPSPASQVAAVAFSGNGKFLATAQRDDTIRLANLGENKPPLLLKGTGYDIRKIAVSPDGAFLLISGGNEALVYTPERQAVSAVFRPLELEVGVPDPGDNKLVNSVEFSSDGSLAAVARGNKVFLWDTSPLKQVLWSALEIYEERFPKVPLVGHLKQVNSARFSPDGKFVVTASDDHTARLWDLDGKLIYQFVGHASEVTDASFSPDGKFVVTAGKDGTCRVWDTQTGLSVTVLRGHQGAVTSASFSPDGEYVVSTGADKTTRVWERNVQKPPSLLRGEKEALSDVAVSPDGELVAASSFFKGVRVWDAAGAHEDLSLSESPISHVAFSADNKRLLITDVAGSLVWDTKTKRLVSNPSLTGAVSPDGRLLVQHESGGMAVYEIGSGARVATLSIPSWLPINATFSPDSRLVAATESTNKRILVWNLKSANKPLILTLPGSANLADLPSVIAVVFSPDGNSLLVARVSGEAYIWDISKPTSAELRFTLEARDLTYLRDARYSRDGRYICTWGGREAWIWDAATGLNLSILSGHSDDIVSANFSLDSRLLVTASKDQTARVWDVESGKSLAEFRGHNGLVSNAVFSPDSRSLITSSYDSNVRIFDCVECRPTADILKVAKLRRFRDMTQPEQARFLSPSTDCTECGDLSSLLTFACGRLTRRELDGGEMLKFALEGGSEQARVCGK